jgi:hypothetical protein
MVEIRPCWSAPRLLVLLVAAIAGYGCNQRDPFLDQAAVTTAPSAVVPAAPAGLARIAFAPPGNRGGTSGRGTVYLDTPSRGAQVVTLASSDAAVVSVSPQVVIPEGASSADFSFTTRQVQRDVNVTIKASSGDRSISDYVSVWTPTTSFLAYSADPGVANPALLFRLSSDAGGAFNATCNNGVVVAHSRGQLTRQMWFAGPVGQPMSPRAFENVTDNVSGNFMVNDAASNCQIVGRFDVHELGVLPNGSVNRLWVSFEHGCRNKPGMVRGTMNVSGPGAAGTAQCVRVR